MIPKRVDTHTRLNALDSSQTGQGQEDHLKREYEYDAKTESAKSETDHSDEEDLPVAIPHPSGKSSWSRNDHIHAGTASTRQRKRQRQSYGRSVGEHDEADEDDKEGVRRMIKRLKEAYERDGGRIDLTADDEDI